MHFADERDKVSFPSDGWHRWLRGWGHRSPISIVRCAIGALMSRRWKKSPLETMGAAERLGATLGWVFRCEMSSSVRDVTRWSFDRGSMRAIYVLDSLVPWNPAISDHS